MNKPQDDMIIIKDFVQIMGHEKNKKQQIANAIYEFHEDLIRAYVSNAHMQRFRETIDELLSLIVTKKFVKGLKFVLKKKNEELYPDGIQPGIVVLLHAAIMKVIDNEEADKTELVNELAESVQKLLNVRINEVGSKVDLPNEILEELLVIAPEPKYLNNKKYIGAYISRLVNALYDIENGLDKEKLPLFADTDALKSLFKALFGKEALAAVGINILLERRIPELEENQLYNLLTEYGLEILNKKKAETGDALSYYLSRRLDDVKRDRDSVRRIVLLNDVDEEKYPHLYKTIKDMEQVSRGFFSK